jgi:hypothetical protein
VEPGRDYGVELEIVNGLKAGEEVVVDPSDAVQEGALVQIAAPNSNPKGRAMRRLVKTAASVGTSGAGRSADRLPAELAFVRPYEAKPVPPVNFQNSERIFDLMRAGQLYLSLADAIALALENNLDIEVERYLPRIAQTDISRAKGGGLLRGLSLLVNEPPPGIGGPNGPLLTSLTASSTPAPAVNTNFSDVALITEQQNDLSVTGATSAVHRYGDSTIRSGPFGTNQLGASKHSGIQSADHRRVELAGFK